MHYQRARYHGELDLVAPDSPRPCAQCGEMVGARRWGWRYCSAKCKEVARYYERTADMVRPTLICLECSAVLTGRRDKSFCSPKCSEIWRNRQVGTKKQLARVAALPPCPACGEKLPAGSKRRTFCSDECKVEARQAVSYGMTVRQLHEMREAQGHACAICRTVNWGYKGPAVDHCHDSNVVRGLLCHHCNVGLGHFKDDPDRLRAAIAYLER